MSRHLYLLAKHWTPGQVKTRLAVTRGNAFAAEFHRVCLETLLDRLEPLADRRVLYFAPTERQDAFARLNRPAWELAPQGAGDLGDRLLRCTEEAFQRGARQLVIIGSDSPTLPVALVESAFRALQPPLGDARPVVMAPVDDGGYCLVGLNAPCPEIFTRIPWSTSDVLSVTQLRCREAGRPMVLLPTWYDIDDAPGLLRLAQELASYPAAEFAALRTLIAAGG